MRREFTRREKVLLLFLVVVLLFSGYMKLFLEPLNGQLASARDQLASAQDSLTMEQTKLLQLRKMEKALEGGPSGAAPAAEIPDYDNIDNVMIQLDAILTAASDYQMTFADVQFGDELASRPIQLAFTAGSYGGARTILTALYDCRYCCGLSDIAVSAAADGGSGDVTAQSVSVKLTVTFYEKYDRAAQTDRAAGAVPGASSASGEA